MTHHLLYIVPPKYTPHCLDIYTKQLIASTRTSCSAKTLNGGEKQVIKSKRKTKPNEEAQRDLKVTHSSFFYRWFKLPTDILESEALNSSKSPQEYSHCRVLCFSKTNWCIITCCFHYSLYYIIV